MAQDVQINRIPTQLADTARSGLNMRFIIGGLLLLAFVGFLAFQIVRATTTTGAYFLTVSELLSMPNMQGQHVRVNGNVVAGTEEWDAQQITLKFAIADENGTGEMLPIVFKGPRPDNFQRAASAIVEGEMQPDGTFVANELLLKCPSRYEEEPSEVHVKATH